MAPRRRNAKRETRQAIKNTIKLTHHEIIEILSKYVGEQGYVVVGEPLLDADRLPADRATDEGMLIVSFEAEVKIAKAISEVPFESKASWLPRGGAVG